jgi:membrane protein YqaA with SNARE-associated domain
VDPQLGDVQELLGLLASAFLAATLLPGGSEVVLLAMDAKTAHPDWLLVLVASVGNTLGSMSSWWLGHLAPQHAGFSQRHASTIERVRRYGAPALLLSWIPILGDPLALIGGWLRLPFWSCLMYVAIGKTARYSVIVTLI